MSDSQRDMSDTSHQPVIVWALSVLDIRVANTGKRFLAVFMTSKNYYYYFIDYQQLLINKF